MISKFKIFATVSSFAITYLMISFVKLNLNFSCWSEETRIGFILFFIMFLIFFLLMEATIKHIDEITKNNLNK